MPVQGNLATMSLTEILQWLGNAGKTGTLSIERNKVVKRILVREGRVIACASQEPADMLGHFLVSRGKISEETASQGARRCRKPSAPTSGRILVATGALSEDDLRLLLEDKAQETIFGLFDWDDAEFRFADGETADPNIFAVNMRVDDILPARRAALGRDAAVPERVQRPRHRLASNGAHAARRGLQEPDGAPHLRIDQRRADGGGDPPPRARIRVPRDEVPLRAPPRGRRRGRRREASRPRALARPHRATRGRGSPPADSSAAAPPVARRSTTACRRSADRGPNARLRAVRGRGRRSRIRATPAESRRVRLRARDPRPRVQGATGGRSAATPPRRGGGVVRREVLHGTTCRPTKIVALRGRPRR